MRRIRPRSVYDVLALASFFLVIGGGTALASYVVSSNSQVGPNTISGHEPPTGKHANILSGSVNATDLANGAGTLNKLAPNSVNSARVVNGSLKSADTDPSSIQHRLGGGCHAGNAIKSVAQDGASTCTAIGFTQVTLRSGHSATASAKVLCQPGETVVGGGFDGAGEAFTSEPAAASVSSQQGWTADTNSGPVTAYALCAK